jgi:hypothetical protein
MSHLHNLSKRSGQNHHPTRLSQTTPAIPGMCICPCLSVTVSYVAQLVAEVVQMRMVKGSPVRKWLLPSGKRNEAFDSATKFSAACRFAQTKSFSMRGSLRRRDLSLKLALQSLRPNSTLG